MRPQAYRAAALVLALCTLTSGPAGAQPAASPQDQARRHHDRGTTFYNLGQFEQAIGEYRRGYEQQPHPMFLFNIAQGYRQLGVNEKALFFYRRYLSTHQNALNRPQVEERIVELEALVSPEVRARLAPAPEPLEPLPPDLGPVPEAAVATPARPAAREMWQRWWFWGAIAGVVAGGVAVALLARSADRTAPPATDLGSMRFF